MPPLAPPTEENAKEKGLLHVKLSEEVLLSLILFDFDNDLGATRARNVSQVDTGCRSTSEDSRNIKHVVSFA